MECTDALCMSAYKLMQMTVRACTYLCICIQLFRERLSYKRGELYATMSKVMMGHGGFVVAWLKLKVFQCVEGNSTNPCIQNFSCLLSQCLAFSTPWTSIKQRQTLATHNTNRHCRVRFYTFVGQPLLKQLYTYVHHPSARLALNKMFKVTKLLMIAFMCEYLH